MVSKTPRSTSDEHVAAVPNREDDSPRIAAEQARFIEDFAKLADALRRSVSEPSAFGGDTILFQQQQYALLLALVMKFFARWCGKEVAEKFFHLSEMFNGLQHGQQHPILKPPKFQNRPPARADIWLVRARAVSGLEALHASGMKLREAAKLAARKAPGLKQLVENRAALDTSLLSWRRMLKTGKVTEASPAAHAFYEETQAWLCSDHQQPSDRLGNVPVDVELEGAALLALSR